MSPERSTSPQASTPKLSVVIVTYRRHEPLCDSLRKLAPHYNPGWAEVIVVDQCPPQPLPTDILALSGLRYIVLDKPSMVEARNVGIRFARGEIVLFLDDDVVPLPGLIENHVAAYTDPSVGGVAGRILDPGKECDTPPANSKSFDPVHGWEYAHFDHTVPGDVMTSRGCNMSFQRLLLLGLGGFDRNIKIFRDDTDMCLRVIQSGKKIRFVPAAALVHLNASSGGTRGESQSDVGYWSRELTMYRQHHRHYRDNLYFLLRHFRGNPLLHQLVKAYRGYVGVSRWPWRLVAKNFCFLTALWQADNLARRRKYHPCSLTDC